ncbi:hypothetical protein D5086_008523 [Populus alba]|uniref:Uncharacterized protein n=1 Tax=Populus alba TaxID=43335 RepID=A0ACC4CHB1_POPAL
MYLYFFCSKLRNLFTGNSMHQIQEVRRRIVYGSSHRVGFYRVPYNGLLGRLISWSLRRLLLLLSTILSSVQAWNSSMFDPSFSVDDDAITWSLSSDGDFYSKSTYELLEKHKWGESKFIADVLAFVCDIEKSQQLGPAANRDRKELWECWNDQGDIALFNTDPYNTLKYF